MQGVTSATAHMPQPISESPGVASGRGLSLVLSQNCGTTHVPQHVGHVRPESMRVNRGRWKQNEYLATRTATACRGDRELRRAGPRHWPNRTQLMAGLLLRESGCFFPLGSDLGQDTVYTATCGNRKRNDHHRSSILPRGCTGFMCRWG